MEKQDIRKIISANVKALLRHEQRADAGWEPGPSALMRKNFANGTAQRILAGETSYGVEMVDRIAEAFGVEPWQLLVPDLDVADRPFLSDAPAEWPFSMVDREAYEALGEADRAFVQGKAAAALEERQAAMEKRQPRRHANGRP